MLIRNMWLSLLAVMVGFFVAAGYAAAEANDKVRTITVTASGHVEAEPDLTMISIGVVTEGQSAKEALEDNSKRFAAVLAGIKQLGIAAKDIATDQFQVSPIYARTKSSRGNQMNQIDGYRVHNTATITVRNISQTGAVIDRATEAGANNIGAIEFMVSDIETRLDEARKMAMRNAIRRATLYAEAAGASLDEIMTISEQHHGFNGRRARMGGGRASAMAAPAPIEPGSQKIGVTVHAVWSLR